MIWNRTACGSARPPRLRPLVLAVALGLGACAGEEPPPAAAPTASAWREDPRLIDLFTLCATRGHFDGDTSDLVPVLVDKLTVGQLEVIRNLREELAAMGDAAIPALDAVVRRSYSDRFGTPALRNVLGVLRLSEAEGAHDIARRCLEHPSEDVRAEAAAALAKHARPEDYEALASLLPVSSPAVRQSLVGAMHTALPERLAEDLAVWLRDGANRDLWASAARSAAGSARDRAPELYGGLLDDVVDPETRAFLLAALVNAGDEQALEELRAMLTAGSLEAGTRALEAIERTGRLEELLAALDSGGGLLRLRALSLLEPVAREPWARAALSAALQDPRDDVRQVALGALLSIGDEAAADLALTLLGGSRRHLTVALMSLRSRWDANPGLAARAYELLARRLTEEGGRSLDEDEALLQAMGQVPDPRAAELLLARGRAAEGETIHKMSGHRWLAREAGNTGPGRAVLREAWRAEPDEGRRMDLLEGASFGLDDETRAFLLDVLESERASDWERLYVAERLARQGPSSLVAPILKRAALRCAHPDVRPAFDCLLWRWYGLDG